MAGHELSARAMHVILNETCHTSVKHRKATLCGFESELRPVTIQQITAIVKQTLLPELQNLLMECRIGRTCDSTSAGPCYIAVPYIPGNALHEKGSQRQ